MDVKQLWVRKMRQLIQETYFGSNSGPPGISSLAVPTSSRGHKHTTSQRSSRLQSDSIIIIIFIILHGSKWKY